MGGSVYAADIPKSERQRERTTLSMKTDDTAIAAQLQKPSRIIQRPQEQDGKMGHASNKRSLSKQKKQGRDNSRKKIQNTTGKHHRV